jgi:hypothetical protein
MALTELFEEVKLTKQKKTWRGYKIAHKYFRESWPNTTLRTLIELMCCASLHFWEIITLKVKL